MDVPDDPYHYWTHVVLREEDGYHFWTHVVLREEDGLETPYSCPNLSTLIRGRELKQIMGEHSGIDPGRMTIQPPPGVHYTDDRFIGILGMTHNDCSINILVEPLLVPLIVALPKEELTFMIKDCDRLITLRNMVAESKNWEASTIQMLTENEQMLTTCWRVKEIVAKYTKIFMRNTSRGPDKNLTLRITGDTFEDFDVEFNSGSLIKMLWPIIWKRTYHIRKDFLPIFRRLANGRSKVIKYILTTADGRTLCETMELSFYDFNDDDKINVVEVE